MTETFSIEVVHTASDEHCLTAYDSDDNPVCSLVDSGSGWEITDPVEGERTARLEDVDCDLASPGPLHKRMYELSDQIDCD